MSAAFSKTLTLPSPQATSDLACRIGQALGPGDVILLEGHIGAGKTHFARALIQDLLCQSDRFEDVPSPTFTLVQTYEAGPLEIWHADLYRLTHPDEVLELGLDDAFDTALCLVEWPDRLSDLTPENALTMCFTATGQETRRVTMSASDPKWATLLKGCLDDHA